MNVGSATKTYFDNAMLQKVYSKIDDLDERAPGKYDEDEADLRRKLACAYRMVDMFGWTNGIYGHLTARTKDHHILLNPFGMLFHEITASCLVKIFKPGRNINGFLAKVLGQNIVTVDAKVLDPGTSSFGFNPRAYTLHSAIHDARKDVVAAVHLHIPEVMALSALDLDYIPLFQEFQFVGPVSTHGFSGILVDLSERDSIIKDLGNNDAMLLKNHGFVTCGVSVEDAFFKAWLFISGAKAVANMLACPQSMWLKPDTESVQRSYDALKHGENVDGIQYEPGELNWQAWMRVLDNMGLKTGYKYRKQLWKK